VATEKSNLRDERRVENEYMFRNMNEQYEKSLLEHMNVEQFEEKKLDFYCECSDPNCLEKILISAKQFDDIHDRSNQFVIRTGHEQLDIEDIIGTIDSYTVVQKHPEKL
jgi:redox-regulated HSP33 family molecular chaperone